MFMPKRKINRPIILVVALLGSVAELVSAQRTLAQTTAYTVLELSAMADVPQVPCRLNNLGDIAGRAGNSAAGQTRAMIWSHGMLQPKRLGALPGGEYSSASTINDAREVAGGSNTSNSIVPFIWTTTGGLQRVPLLPGDKCGQALGINKYGHVAGYSSGRNGTSAFLWTRAGGVRNLGSLPGGNYSRARAVNDSDEVIGTSASMGGDRAVLWTKIGNVRDLGTLPGDTSSEGLAINNAGDVVGYSKGPGGLRAFLWTESTGMQDLGVLPGGHSSRALDINDVGCVVGSSTSSSGERAFVWTKQAGMTDLNSASSAQIGTVFFEAHAINQKGQILVMGKMEESSPEGSPSPENQMCAPAPPSSFLLTPITLK
jgi:probable HAF family extracellular repeat protein